MPICAPGSVGHNFASTTSAHGFARLVTSTSLIQKGMWLSFIGGGFCMSIWMVSLRFIAYFEYGTTSDITIKFQPKMMFPAVTICNFNRYELNKLTPGDDETLVTLMRAIDYSEYRPIYYKNDKFGIPDGEYQDYLHQYGRGDRSSSTNQDMGDYYSHPNRDPHSTGGRSAFIRNSESNYNYQQGDSVETGSRLGSELVNFTLHKGMKWDNKTVTRCLFKGYLCDLEKDFTHTFTTFGNCYTFNVDGEKYQDLPGKKNGLQLVINIQQGEYTEQLSAGGSMEAGIIFEIHPQWEPPEVDRNGLAVGPGNHAYASILKQEYSELPPPWGSCNPEAELLHFKDYSLTGCILECKLKKIKEYCGCRLLYHPGNSTVCSPQQVNDCVVWVLVKVKQKFSTICNYCRIPCNSTVFASKISYAAIPSKSSFTELLQKYSRSERHIMRGENRYELFQDTSERANEVQFNIVQLDIYYQDLNIYKTIKRPVIELSALISDIGGQLGLFLGFSALTFIEMFEFFLLSFSRCLTKWRQSRMHAEEEEEGKSESKEEEDEDKSESKDEVLSDQLKKQLEQMNYGP